MKRLLRVEIIGNVEAQGSAQCLADVTWWQQFSIEHLMLANR
jgi:hypothetical protein